MIIKLSQFVNSSQALSRLMAQPMRAVVAFSLGKTARLIEPELKAYDEARVKLLKEYGEPTETDPTRYEFKSPEKAQSFADELNAVLEQGVEIEFKPVTLENLAKSEISASDVLVLDWLIDSGDEDVK